MIRPATYSGPGPNGSVTISGLNALETTTVRITFGAIPAAPVNNPAGVSSLSLSAPALSAGDTIKVEQPTGVLQETYTVPVVSIAGTAGSANLTGQAPDGTVAIASYRDVCFGSIRDDIAVQPQGGAFAVAFPKPLVPGSRISVLNYPGKGDQVGFEDRVPGESPCVSTSANDYPLYPGDTPDPKPYRVRVTELRSSVTTGVRLVLRRGGVIVVDESDPTETSSHSVNTAVRPSAGDVVEVYRPHTALAPSVVYTVPVATATFDVGNSLTRVDAPAASRIDLEAGSLYTMFQSRRSATNTSAGATFFNFAAPAAEQPPFSLANASYLDMEWFSPDGRYIHQVTASPGDLTAPALKIKLGSKFKLSKITKSISASITSSEAVTAKLTVTLPAALKTSAKKKSKSPRVIATAKITLKAGTTKVKIKLTSSGKKLLAKMRKLRYPANKATLSLAATDLAGNPASATKTTKLVSR